jgi:hypothetical protein
MKLVTLILIPITATVLLFWLMANLLHIESGDIPSKIKLRQVEIVYIEPQKGICWDCDSVRMFPPPVKRELPVTKKVEIEPVSITPSALIESNFQINGIVMPYSFCNSVMLSCNKNEI